MTKNELAKILGERIRVLRTVRKMKQSELAEMLEVTGGYISILEAGHSLVSIHKLIEICEKLVVDFDYFNPFKSNLTIDINPKNNKLLDKRIPNE